ncbi:hypothetical protein DLAC_11754 [Tieghemostelium lacteum]|uniref:IPT/TIG domain-containing protein n=1 Tax=Tieghemostelium lacteum TaxID=361077 RepID=A0A151Z8T1_TIELA|nr:hypothetical protein DLAC_11754 [Tieghemostelium lacteum]|eukprot:KYQ90365.1 hypothetical protein DLAC_11754 [Tieghemostelium lacteum]
MFKFTLFILILFLNHPFLVYSQIIAALPDAYNSETQFTFKIAYDTIIPVINNLIGDSSKEVYIPTCETPLGGEIQCILSLNNRSQTEKYTINYDGTNHYKTIFPFELQNKYLFEVSKPNVSQIPILQFNGLFFQPFPPIYNLNIYISNLGVSKYFTFSDNSSFSDSTNFNIPLNDSVGEITIKITQGKYNTSFITHYSEPKINTIECDNIQCTINGYNFGNSKFKNLTKIIFDSKTIYFNNSNNIPIQYNNTQIQFNHNNNFSKESSFSISVSSISSIKPFNYTFRPIIKSISTIPFSGGEITINGYFLNSKRENGENSTISIQIGSFTCQNPSNIIENDFTSIKCLMNGNDGSNSENLPISIEIDGVENEMTSIKFTFNLPTITSIQHNIIDFNNDSLIINGFNFNNFDGTINPILHFNNQSKSISNTNNNNNKTSISIQLLHFFDNNQTLKNGNIQIQTPTNRISNLIRLRLKPFISRIEGRISKSGGLITIIGNYLQLIDFNGFTLPISIINQNNNSICSNPKQIENINNINNNNIDIFTCEHSSTTSINNNSIIIIIDNQQSNSNIQIQFEPPIINSIDNSHSPINNIILTINGFNFGTDSTLFQIQINNNSIESNHYRIISITFEQIQIELINQPINEGNIKISINSQFSNLFKYYFITQSEYIEKNDKKLSIGMIFGDLSKEIYIPNCHNTNNIIYCDINLNNKSQSEKYSIFYDQNKNYLTSPFQLKNKYILDISKPNISESPILHFNGLYFQPYPIYFPLLVKISNLGVSQLFTLTDNSSFTDSTHFQIPLNDSVGEITVEITQGQFTNSYITHYSESVINYVKCDYIKCTINGYNFGNSKFKNLTEIIFDSTTIHFNNSNNIPIQYNNTQIQFNHNNNFSKESSFSISISSISSINPFNYTFRPIISSISTIPFSGGEITINGYFLNSKRENGDNSTISIQIGSFTCQNPSNIIENDFTSIKCLMNGNDGSNSENLPISIEIDGVENEMTSIKFTFNLPTITSIQHDIIDFNNDSLIINGFNFNNFDGTINPIIHFNNQSKSISNTNNNNNKTSISIQLLHFFDNNQTLKNGNIQIQTPTNRISNLIRLRLKPFISRIEGRISKSGGLITIIGNYLQLIDFNGFTLPISIINQNHNSICSNPKQIENINNNNNNIDIITCEHSSTTSINNNLIIIIIDNQQSNSNIQIQFKPPIINSVDYIPSSSSSTINSIEFTINGFNFGTDSTLFQIEINNNSIDSIHYNIKSITFEEIQIELIMSQLSQPIIEEGYIKITINSQSSNLISYSLKVQPEEITNKKDKSLSIGIIIGIVLAVLVLISLAIVITLYRLKMINPKLNRHKKHVEIEELKKEEEMKDKPYTKEERNNMINEIMNGKIINNETNEIVKKDINTTDGSSFNPNLQGQSQVPSNPEISDILDMNGSLKQ